MLENKKIGIIGTGLIGGSLALALKKADSTIHINGFNRNHLTSKKAKEGGAVDAVCSSIEELAENSDIIVICTPLSSYENIISAILPYLNSDKIVTDVGSTKFEPFNSIKSKIPSELQKIFVWAHPIAGKEKSGFDVAEASLYQGKRTIITPFSNTDGSKIEIISNMWELTGSKVETMKAEKHDQIYASVSHFVQLLSFKLSPFFSDDYKSQSRDFTRLMDSPKEIWQDIFQYNKDAINQVSENFIRNLNSFIELTPNGVFENSSDLIDESKIASVISKLFIDSINPEFVEYAGSGYKSFTSMECKIDVDSLSQTEINKLQEIKENLKNELQIRDLSRHV